MNNSSIGVYFAGKISDVYQLEQWLLPLYELDKKAKITVIVRSIKVCEYLENSISLSVYYVESINDLIKLYENLNIKLLLYVNNIVKNFQSLRYNKALHIHLNHGESEKSSMHSNQVKAYDYVYVVGDAALDRYKRHLINIKRANFVKIGRPQLDFVAKNITKPAKTVILYAPTDESTHISMRYTSLDRLGEKIVDTILANENYFLIYRPHPRTGKHDKKIDSINKRIISKVEKSKNGMLESEMNAIDLLSIVDLAIFDNSSLIIDFLYFDKPIFATDMFLEEYHNKKVFKMLDGCIMLDEDNIDNLSDMLEEELQYDTWKEKRREVKAYYLGNYKKGESTKIFIVKVLEAIKERDKLLS